MRMCRRSKHGLKSELFFFIFAEKFFTCKIRNKWTKNALGIESFETIEMHHFSGYFDIFSERKIIFTTEFDVFHLN